MTRGTDWFLHRFIMIIINDNLSIGKTTLPFVISQRALLIMINVIILKFSYSLDELYELGPLFLPSLHTPPYNLKLSYIRKGILNIFSTLFAHDHKDSIIQLIYAIFIDDPRCVGKVLQPFIGEYYINFFVVSVFVIEG